jgi:hypothetical protein
VGDNFDLTNTLIAFIKFIFSDSILFIYLFIYLFISVFGFMNPINTLPFPRKQAIIAPRSKYYGKVPCTENKWMVTSEAISRRDN